MSSNRDSVRDSIRVWIRAAVARLGVAAAFVAWSAPALGDSYVVYVHGRAQTRWDESAVYPIAGFQPAFVSYNATTATLAQANVDVRAGLARYCSGENVCIVVAYSNGALQVGYTQAYYPEALDNALYIEAGASAAGGSELLGGFTGIVGNVLGSTYPTGVDATLSVSGARNAYNHNLHAGVVTYHIGGNTTWRNALWYLDAALLPGNDDGIVSFASAFGCAASGSQPATCARYAGHALDSGTSAGRDPKGCPNAICGSVDHDAMDDRAAYWAF
jgi:hypothetical protein